MNGRGTIVAALGTTQTLAWASSYYLPAVLGAPIAAGLGLPTSAFFAVVNVITRTGARLDGVSVTFENGTLGTRLARGSVGRLFANGVDVALSGTFERSDGVGRLYFPAFDAPATLVY